MPSSTFDRIWNDRPLTFRLEDPLDLRGPCPFAVAFQAWIDALFERQLAGADLITLNQLKVHVQDRFFRFRSRVPREHQHEDGREPDHWCLFAVFEKAIEELHRRELELAPPPLVPLPAPLSPPPPPRARFDGLLVGDLDDSEFDGH